MKNFLISVTGKWLIPMFLFFCGIPSFAQYGPNLTAGSEGLVFSQGQLDAQLIVNIIASKRGEIKKELGKKLILDRLEGGSYAFYSYAERNLNTLFNEGNKAVITKELMQNSAELLLVYGLAEYMLQDIRKQGHYDEATNTLLSVLFDMVDKPNHRLLVDTFNFFDDSTSRQDASQNNYSLKGQLKYTQPASSPGTGKYLLKPELTTLLTNRYTPGYKEPRNNYYSAITMFADMIYDACLRNPHVIATGMFQSENKNSPRYRALSKYWYFEKVNPEIFSALQHFQPRVDSVLNYLFQYYHLFIDFRSMADEDMSAFFNAMNDQLADRWIPLLATKSLDNLRTLSTNKIDNKAIIRSTYQTPTALQVALDETQRLLDSLQRDVLKIGSANCENCSGEEYQNKLGMQKKLLNIPLYIKNGKANVSAKYYLDLAYTLKKEYLPELTALNLTQNGNLYGTVIARCDSILKNLNAAAYHYMVKDSNNMKRYIYSLQNYLPLLEIINNLDRVESYDYMFKFLSELSETYGDSRSKMVVRMLTNLVDKYSTINKDENKISIDVEGLATDLFKQFAANQQSRITPFLTVGLNHNTALGNNFQFLNSSSSDTASVQSAFVSEKIGLRLNVFDFNRKRSFNRYNLYNGNTRKGPFKNMLPNKSKVRQMRASKIGVQPVINNIHAVVYGSGLLYQIKALNSADKFNAPVFGAGAGVTFFNGLDLNLSYALPFSFNTSEGFLCVSFDISIFEYLGALQQKKK